MSPQFTSARSRIHERTNGAMKVDTVCSKDTGSEVDSRHAIQFTSARSIIHVNTNGTMEVHTSREEEFLLRCLSHTPSQNSHSRCLRIFKTDLLNGNYQCTLIY